MGSLEVVYRFCGNRSVVAGACNIRRKSSLVTEDILQRDHISFLAFVQRQVRRLVPCAVPWNKFKRLGEDVSRLPGPGGRLRLWVCLLFQSKVHKIAGI